MPTRRGVRLGCALALAIAGSCRDATPPATPSGSTGDVVVDPTTGSSSDGESSSTGAPLGPLRLRFDAIEVEGGLAMATAFAFLPDTDELLVTSKNGRVGHYRLAGDRLERLGEFTVPNVYSDLDCGLISIAIDPAFDENALVYVAMCTSMTDSGVYRMRFVPPDYDAIGDTLREVMSAGDPTAPKPWHNVGSIGFDATGALWALFGDKRVPENGQDLGDDLSALVRVIPDRSADGAGASPAPDNPFLGDPDRSPNVYAYGLRSPWRGIVDARGRFWIGDVGANGVEEIDLVTAPGQNFGWPHAEGPCEGSCANLIDPVTYWPHDVTTEYMLDDEDVRATVARVAWVGLEVRPFDPDPYDGQLTGAVLFGDFCLGFVRAIEVDDDGRVLRDEPMGHLAMPSAWAQGRDGFVYATTFGKCETAGLNEDDPPLSGFWRAVASQSP